MRSGLSALFSTDCPKLDARPHTQANSDRPRRRRLKIPIPPPLGRLARVVESRLGGCGSQDGRPFRRPHPRIVSLDDHSSACWICKKYNKTWRLEKFNLREPEKLAMKTSGQGMRDRYWVPNTASPTAAHVQCIIISRPFGTPRRNHLRDLALPKEASP